jgi:uncharacterized protein YqhQ
MPRIRENKQSSEELNKQLDAAQEKVSVDLHKEEKEAPAEPKKKEPNWTLWYVVAAIGVFVLGILVICLMNYFIEGKFAL